MGEGEERGSENLRMIESGLFRVQLDTTLDNNFHLHNLFHLL